MKILCIFLLLPLLGQSQSIKFSDIKVYANFDSLKKAQLHQTGNDKLKTLLCLQKSYFFWFQADTTYLDTIDSLIRKISPTELHLIQYFKAHFSLIMMAKSSTTFKFANSSFLEFKKREDIEGQVAALTILGIVSQSPDGSKYKSSTNYLKYASDLSKKSTNIECLLLGKYSQCRLFRERSIDEAINLAKLALNQIKQEKNSDYLAPFFYDILSMAYIIKKNVPLSLEYETLIIETYKKNIATVPIAIVAKNLRSDFPDIQKQIMLYFFEKKDQEKEFLLKEKEALSIQNRLYIVIYIITFISFCISIWFVAIYKRKNNLLKIANDNIVQSNQLKEYFYGIIAHDLRQPLVGFSSVRETFNYYISKKDYLIIEKLVAALDLSGKKMKMLCDNLLSWAVAQKDEIPFNPTTFNIYDIIHSTISMYEYNIDTKNIKVTVKGSKQLFLYSDQEGFEIVIRNIFCNALKNIKKDVGRINIEFERLNEKNIKINITDNGCGIEDSELSVIKDVLSNPNKFQPGEKGLGLGLILVSRFISHYNGKVEVETSPNHGTTFTINL